MNKIVKVQVVLLSAVIMLTGTVGLQAGPKIKVKRPAGNARLGKGWSRAAQTRLNIALERAEKTAQRQERTEGIQHASEHTDGARVSAKRLTGISEREGGVSASETSKAFNRTRTGTLGLDLFDKSLQKEITEVFPEESRPQVEQAFDRVNALRSQEPAHRVTLSSKTQVTREPALDRTNFVNGRMLISDLSERFLEPQYPELARVLKHVLSSSFELGDATMREYEGLKQLMETGVMPDYQVSFLDIRQIVVDGLDHMRSTNFKYITDPEVRSQLSWWKKAQEDGTLTIEAIEERAPGISQAIDYFTYRTYRFANGANRLGPVYEADMAVQIHKLWGDLLQGKLDAEVTEQMISDFFTDSRVKKPTLDYAWLEQFVTRVEADYFVNGKLTGIDVLGMSKETTETFLKEGGAKKMNIDASMEVSVGMSTILLTHGLESTPWFYRLVGQDSRLMARIQGLRELVDRQVASLQSNAQ